MVSAVSVVVVNSSVPTVVPCVSSCAVVVSCRD